MMTSMPDCHVKGLSRKGIRYLCRCPDRMKSSCQNSGRCECQCSRCMVEISWKGDVFLGHPFRKTGIDRVIGRDLSGRY